MASPATDERPASRERLPTLTEVLVLGPATATAPPPPPPPPPTEAARGRRATDKAPVAAPDEAAIAEQVLRALAPEIDRLLEARLREALAPALARAAQALISESRDQLDAALPRLVHEAVVRALDQVGKMDEGG